MLSVWAGNECILFLVRIYVTIQYAHESKSTRLCTACSVTQCSCRVTIVNHSQATGKYALYEKHSLSFVELYRAVMPFRFVFKQKNKNLFWLWKQRRLGRAKEAIWHSGQSWGSSVPRKQTGGEGALREHPYSQFQILGNTLKNRSAEISSPLRTVGKHMWWKLWRVSKIPNHTNGAYMLTSKYQALQRYAADKYTRWGQDTLTA